MSSLAPTLQAFFTDRLMSQHQASPRTIAAYRDTFRLLLGFAQQRTGKAPSQLEIDDLDAPMIAAFLDHLETERHNTARTRNARRAAIRSLFNYAAVCHPKHAAVIQRVLAIPQKLTDTKTIAFLHDDEIEALVAAPDRGTWEARRDHALIYLAVHTGLRVSELTALNQADVHLDTGPHLRCEGKGRKQRAVPFSPTTAAVLRVWLQERQGTANDPLFCTRTGRRLTRDAIARRLQRHAVTAAQTCPTLATKKLTPHVLRHTAAMQLLAAGVDIAVIALWLGHADLRSTQAYVHADLAIKERALEKTAPASTPPGRYRPPDKLLAFLEAL